MAARLVITTFNGKPNFSIQYLPSSREPRLGRVLETVELTNEELELGLTVVRQRWANRSLFHAPRKVAA